MRTAISALLMLVIGVCSAQTYQYEPAQSVVSGVLTRELGQTPDGARVRFPAVRLPRPITIEGDEETPTEKGAVMLHVILKDRHQSAAFERYLGRRVDITGRLMRSENGHHQTNVLIISDAIEPAR